MKNVFFTGAIAFFITGCSLLKPVGASNSTEPAQKQSSPQFLDKVSIQSGRDPGTDAVARQANKRNSGYRPEAHFSHGSAIENYSPLQFKYAILEDASVEQLQNEKLLEFMEEWVGTKYHFGGVAKDGIDCSAFVTTLMTEVYGVASLPRMSKDQYLATLRINHGDLQEGDLVFFNTNGRKKAVTHVGVYLRNNKFVHASISGVMISDMADGYYAAHFVGGGRVLNGSSREAFSN